MEVKAELRATSMVSTRDQCSHPIWKQSSPVITYRVGPVPKHDQRSQMFSAKTVAKGCNIPGLACQPQTAKGSWCVMSGLSGTGVYPRGKSWKTKCLCVEIKLQSKKHFILPRQLLLIIQLILLIYLVTFYPGLLKHFFKEGQIQKSEEVRWMA